MLYARAYEIAGRRPDIDQSRDLAGKLKEGGQFTIRLQVSGPADRVKSFEETVEKAVVGITDATLSGSSSSDLTMRITVGKQRCSESKETTPQSKEYVSGQVEKPNPIWHQLNDQRDQVAAEEKTASERVAELEPQVKEAEATLRDFDARISKAQTGFDGFQGKIEQAEAQLRAAQAVRDELSSELDGMRTSGGSAEAISQWEGKLSEQAKRVTEWQTVIMKHQDDQSSFKRELDALNVEREPAAEAVNRLKSGFDSVTQDRNTAQTEYARLTTELAKTPKTVWEDVYDTFEYELYDWTRSCVAPVTVAMTPRWETVKDKKREFEPENTTTDQSHVGFEKADIAVDDKEFPETDTALVAKGDAATGTEVVEWLSELADDHFRTYTLDTMVALQEDPERSTTDLVSLYVGAPGRLDEQTLNTFATHVKQHYGLEKIELLRGGAAPPTQ